MQYSYLYGTHQIQYTVQRMLRNFAVLDTGSGPNFVARCSLPNHGKEIHRGSTPRIADAIKNLIKIHDDHLCPIW